MRHFSLPIARNHLRSAGFLVFSTALLPCLLPAAPKENNLSVIMNTPVFAFRLTDKEEEMPPGQRILYETMSSQPRIEDLITIYASGNDQAKMYALVGLFYSNDDLYRELRDGLIKRELTAAFDEGGLTGKQTCEAISYWIQDDRFLPYMPYSIQRSVEDEKSNEDEIVATQNWTAHELYYTYVFDPQSLLVYSYIFEIDAFLDRKNFRDQESFDAEKWYQLILGTIPMCGQRAMDSLLETQLFLPIRFGKLYTYASKQDQRYCTLLAILHFYRGLKRKYPEASSPPLELLDVLTDQELQQFAIQYNASSPKTIHLEDLKTPDDAIYLHTSVQGSFGNGVTRLWEIVGGIPVRIREIKDITKRHTISPEPFSRPGDEVVRAGWEGPFKDVPAEGYEFLKSEILNAQTDEPDGSTSFSGLTLIRIRDKQIVDVVIRGIYYPLDMEKILPIP